MPALSVIVITRNEAHNIRDCLASVAFADDIVVLDSGSVDGTPELASAAGARVEAAPDWPGFGPQKNRALALARGDWVLSLDADERVTPELAEQIRRVLAAGDAADGYEMPRSSYFCGRFMRHGGWWPDRVLRLFRRSAGRFTDDKVHERVLVQGRIGRLDAPLEHWTYRSLDAALEKMNRYSSLSAQGLQARGRQASLASAIGHGWWAFVRTYFLRRGFLDGSQGFLLAVLNAETSFYRYAKLSLAPRPGTVARDERAPE
jgi:glycosyltransferase involved in cell wall biosynthesis